MPKDKKQSDKEYQQRIRKQAIENLGGLCVQCGTTNRLEVDHIHGDGFLERQSGKCTRTHILRASKGFTYGLQLLCKNCHRAKPVDYKLIFEIKKLEITFAVRLEQIGCNYESKRQ